MQVAAVSAAQTIRILNTVYGAGGVGSTELVNFLTRAGVRCNLLTDQDAVRHVNRREPSEITTSQNPVPLQAQESRPVGCGTDDSTLVTYVRVQALIHHSIAP